MQMRAAVGMVLAVVGATALAGGQAEAARVVVRRTVVARPFVRRPVSLGRPLLWLSAGPVVVVRSGFGRLQVDVDPERARVYVDGRYEGRGDVTRTLPEGTHTVRVVLNDGREAEESVLVEPGRVSVARLGL